MLLLPAIDLKDNQCVRLTQGDYSQKIVYSNDPLEMALEWQRQGAKYLHIVDLDGARGDFTVNRDSIEKIARGVSIPIQVGGGIRTAERARELFLMGVERVILGTTAIENKKLLMELLAEFGSERIVVGVDVKDGYVAVHGWEVVSDINALMFCKELESFGVKIIVYTDISKDGMLSGPNFEIYRTLQEQTGLKIIASGGVSELSDIAQLTEMNIYGCIVGKALYNQQIDFSQALQTINSVKKANLNNYVRIIPCLDVRNGYVVKGKQFIEIKDVDSPEVLAEFYNKSGADELVFYDISASVEGRAPTFAFIKKVAEKVDIPFTVGGGVSDINDFADLLALGADKVSINSGALANPELIREASTKFGSDTVVFAIDAKRNQGGGWNVYSRGGQEDTGIDAIEWVKRAVLLGAGEIVVNSIDGDGMKAGYDIELLKQITTAVDVPVVASGGAGKLEHFYEAVVEAGVDGLLAASVFHFGEIAIKDLKEYLRSKGVRVGD